MVRHISNASPAEQAKPADEELTSGKELAWAFVIVVIMALGLIHWAVLTFIVLMGAMIFMSDEWQYWTIKKKRIIKLTSCWMAMLACSVLFPEAFFWIDVILISFGTGGLLIEYRKLYLRERQSASLSSKSSP